MAAAMHKKFDPVTGEVVPVFFHYAIPSVVGMLAIMSAGVIDGIFICNYVGANALAAVNIAGPVCFYRRGFHAGGRRFSHVR